MLPAGHPLVVGVTVPGMCGLLCHELLQRFVWILGGGPVRHSRRGAPRSTTAVTSLPVSPGVLVVFHWVWPAPPGYIPGVRAESRGPKPCWVCGRVGFPSHIGVVVVNSCTLGGPMPPAFQTSVLPAWSLMPACVLRCLANASHKVRIREGCAVMYISSKYAATRSPSWRSWWNCCSAVFEARENRAGMRGSPCSPTSACWTGCVWPGWSVQM